MDGRTVSTANGPVPLAIVCFPSYAPKLANRVHESLLLEKLLANDRELRNDMNLRVYHWSEFDRFKWEIGVSESAAEWLEMQACTK